MLRLYPYMATLRDCVEVLLIFLKIMLKLDFLTLEIDNGNSMLHFT